MVPTCGYDDEEAQQCLVEANLRLVVSIAKPSSYHMKQPRIRKATVRADGGESYVDLGSGRRIWSIIVLCKMTLYAMMEPPRALQGSTTVMHYALPISVLYSDPLNSTPIAVHIDSYAEVVLDLHIQQVPLSTGSALSLSYEVAIELLEV